MDFSTIIRWLPVAWLAFAPMATRAAERWRHVETPPPGTVQANDFALGTDGALWTFDAAGVRRFDATGTATGTFAATPGTGVYYISGLALADGGAVVQMAATSGACVLTSLDASLRVRWSANDACGTYVATPGGSVWMGTSDGVLRRFGADGSVAARNRAAVSPPLLAAMRDDGLTIANLVYDGTGGSVARYGRDGALRWSFARDGAGFLQLAGGADDSIAVAGIVDNPTTPDALVFYRLDASGALRGAYRSPDANESPLRLVVAEDGASVLLTSDTVGNTVHRLYRFDAAGRLAWRVEVCDGAAEVTAQSLVLLPGGATAFACGGSRWLRFEATGAKIIDTALPLPISKAVLRSDGNIQAIGGSSLRVLDIDGNTVDAPVLQAPAPLKFAGRHFDADGTSWLLSSSAQEVLLSKVKPDGSLAWRRTLPAVAPARLSVAGGQACVAMAYAWFEQIPWDPPPRKPVPASITCFAAADGAERWTRSFPADTAVRHLGALDDGTFIHVRSADRSTTHTFVRYDGAGNEVTHVEGEGFAQMGMIDPTARAVVLALGTKQERVVRYDASGHAQEVAATTETRFEPVGVTAEATLVRAGTWSGDERKYELQSYVTGGGLSWKHPLQTADGVVVASGDAVHVVERVAATCGTATRIERLDARSGASAWTHLSDNAKPESAAMLSAAGGRVALLRRSPDRLRLTWLGAADGAARSEQSVACNSQCGRSPDDGFALDADGTARIALPLVSAAQGATTAVIAVGDTSALPAVRIDQVGLAGAWWAPYANGEGLVVDWLPSSRTWFMPWFTFTRTGGNERDAQRWYTIAGSIPDGATQIELPIVQAVGGSFDAGGGVTSSQVGTAMLRFTDCDNGILRYAFVNGANGGATGTVTLSRLSPATQNCVLADGSTQVRTTAPANGFDARLSGSWHEEATAGQGFEFTVQPGGVFFAPWFTFDPAGTNETNDPGRQRWYTLQGSLANAVNGRVDLVIAQALGGAFDSVPAANQFAVGTAMLTITACDRATLDYRFADDEVAGDLRGRTGTIDLAKSGGCVP